MTNYGTIKLPRDEYERHNERRQEMGLSWADYVDGESPQHDIPNSAEIAEAVVDALDMGDPEDRAGPDFDDLAREVARKIDYVELANRVADELQGRMG